MVDGLQAQGFRVFLMRGENAPDGFSMVRKQAKVRPRREP